MENKIEKYLPIGSVVLLRDAKKRVMVTGFAVKSPQYGDRIFDYIGCLYPEGSISQDKNLLFDHKDIAQIFALGFSDEEQKAFMVKLKDAVSKMEQGLNAQNNTSNQ